MSRYRRPQLPGVPFHITARIQCRERLLSGLEAVVAQMIQEAEARSDAGLVAYAVMQNHIHIVLQQGAQPLSDYMQPLLRRIALLVRRTHGWEGHVFERRYRESACLTPEYLRNAVAYVHLNGLRAGLANSVDAYEWCSHAAFCDNRSSSNRSRMAMEDALRVFAARDGDLLTQCADNYRAFVEWRTLMDARAADSDAVKDWHPPNVPCLAGGDDHWYRIYAPHVRGEVENRSIPPRRLDLRDLAVIIMREFNPDMRLDDLRSGASTRVILQVRRKLVIRAVAVGYTGRAISRFLAVSPATISRIKAQR